MAPERPPRRRRFLVALIVVLVLAAAAGVAWIVFRDEIETYWEEHRPGVSGARVSALAFDPGGRLLAAGTTAGELFIHGANSGKLLGRYQWDLGEVTAVGLSTRESQLAVAHDGRLSLFVFSLARPLGHQLIGVSDVAMPGGGGRLVHVAFKPDDRVIVGIDLRARSVRFFDLDARTEYRPVGGLLPGTTCAALSPEHRHLAQGRADGSVATWDLLTQQEARGIPARGANVDAIAIANGGRLVAIARQGSAQVELWEPQNRAPTHTLVAPGPVAALALSSSGDLVAAAAGRDLVVWSCASGSALTHFAVP